MRGTEFVRDQLSVVVSDGLSPKLRPVELVLFSDVVGPVFNDLPYERLSARAAEMMLTRPEWQGVGVVAGVATQRREGPSRHGCNVRLNIGQRQVGTMESYYERNTDLNEFWMNALDQQRGSVRA